MLLEFGNILDIGQPKPKLNPRTQSENYVPSAARRVTEQEQMTFHYSVLNSIEHWFFILRRGSNCIWAQSTFPFDEAKSQLPWVSRAKLTLQLNIHIPSLSTGRQFTGQII